MTTEEDYQKVRHLLVRAMVKLHTHVVHAGTNFEDECMKALGYPPPTPSSTMSYNQAWREIAAQESVSN